MPPPPYEPSWEPPLTALVERARSIARAAKASDRRRILGIAGPPGAGKSSLATALASALHDLAVCVPMDGFHLAQAELRRLDRADRKGAPDTFDGAGYVALLRRLRETRTETVYAPAFERAIEEPVAGAIAVTADVSLVVTEGNYLLLEDAPWAGVRPLLDEAWYVDVHPGVRVPRLIERHVRFGRTPEAARAWVLRSDEANAARIVATRHRADLVVRDPTEPSAS
jgi:pantothenate kinase